MPRRRVTPASASASLTGLLLATTLGVAPASPADPVDEVLQGDRQRVDRTFSVATLNVLGSQHTRRGDKRRTVRTARLIRRQELKVIALQEVQDDQLRRLKVHLPRYRFWPNENLGPGGLRLQIAWLRHRFDLVDTGSITTTFSNQQRPVPWVRLRDEATGRRIFVIDVHNSPLDPGSRPRLGDPQGGPAVPPAPRARRTGPGPRRRERAARVVLQGRPPDRRAGRERGIGDRRRVHAARPVVRRLADG